MTVLRPVAGFEATAYAWAGRRLVWAGQGAHAEPVRVRQAQTDHARNWHSPWRAPVQRFDSLALRAGAQRLLMRLSEPGGRPNATGLLAWLATGAALPFPLNLAAPRVLAIREALFANDLQALAIAAPRLLGVGAGLTPSGDDLLGGVFFALHHAPRRGWSSGLRTLHRALRKAGHAGATNPISTALLSDLMNGNGYRALHEMLSSLAGGEDAVVDAALMRLLQLGASSGADLLCGLLLALASTPDPSPSRCKSMRVS